MTSYDHYLSAYNAARTRQTVFDNASTTEGRAAATLGVTDGLEPTREPATRAAVCERVSRLLQDPPAADSPEAS